MISFIHHIKIILGYTGSVSAVQNGQSDFRLGFAADLCHYGAYSYCFSHGLFAAPGRARKMRHFLTTDCCGCGLAPVEYRPSVCIELVHGQVTIIFVVSVCLSVCLFVQSFSKPSLIRFRSNKDVCYMSGSSCVP